VTQIVLTEGAAADTTIFEYCRSPKDGFLQNLERKRDATNFVTSSTLAYTRRVWRLVIVGVCVIACGSKSMSPAAARIKEGSDTELTDCAFLQRVSGTASDSDSNAERTAKNAAREEAAKLGATHLKWIVPCCTSVEAEAYRCDLPDDVPD
jgi:hypothetical protein